MGTPIDWLPHPALHSRFTGLHDTQVYIDVLVSSDLLYNYESFAFGQTMPDDVEVAGVTNAHTKFGFFAPKRTIAKYGLYSMQDVADYLPKVLKGEIHNPSLDTRIHAENWGPVSAIFD